MDAARNSRYVGVKGCVGVKRRIGVKGRAVIKGFTRINVGEQTRENPLELTLVWKHIGDRLLGFTQLGGGHEFHRRSYLQRPANRGDPALYLL